MKYLKVNTNLAETLTSIEEKQAMHDDYAKLVLADPQVLANIVKVIVPEFRSYMYKDRKRRNRGYRCG